MTSDPTILVMAGAREAHDVVSALVASGRRLIVYLPEPERSFEPMPVSARIGGLETTEDFQAWMMQNNVVRIVDASHSFDDHISEMVNRAADNLGLGHVRILRPPWQPQANDLWHTMASVQEASCGMPSGAIAFSNTGWLSIAQYADFRGKLLYLRQTHPNREPPPFAFMRFVEGQPPFSQEQEENLFSALKITHLVCRNVGGDASRSKVLAARSLGIEVFMIARPTPHRSVHAVETVEAALDWLAAG